MRVGLDLITHNWTLKLAALGLAVLLWSVTKAEQQQPPTRVSVLEVPVEVALRDTGWVLARPPAPARVSITFAGSEREVRSLVGRNLRVVVPVDAVADSTELRRVEMDWVQLQGDIGGASIDEIRPAIVRLFFERVISREAPVAVRTSGQIPEGYHSTGPIQPAPSAVEVRGPQSRVALVDSVPLRPVALGDLRDTVQLRTAIDTAGLSRLDIEPGTVRLTVPVAPDTAIDAAPGTATDTVTDAAGDSSSGPPVEPAVAAGRTDA